MQFKLDDGAIVVQASGKELDLLDAMLGQLRDLMDARTRDPHRGELLPSDPALARLLPDPVHGDPEAAADTRSLTEAALVAHKLKNAESLGEVIADARIAPAVLDAGSESAWLKTLTDLRLVLATRLGIRQDGDRGRWWTPNDLRMQSAYHWLGAVQMDLLAAMERRDGID